MQILRSRLQSHPCFGLAAHGECGRLHLPVAPLCNIQCVFCNRRYDCVSESAPGVTSKLISPAESLELVRDVTAREPRIKVAGIAGPGDPLANPETFETLSLLRNNFPELILCLSTNGLLLEDTLDYLLAARLDTITITINAATVETAEKIYTSVRLEDVPQDVGVLLERQRRGLALCVESGLTVKINTVLIPGVNDGEIDDIASFAAESGAFIMNITPLIPYVDATALRAPTPKQISDARSFAERHIRQFAHCRQCRADACGLI